MRWAVLCPTWTARSMRGRPAGVPTGRGRVLASCPPSRGGLPFLGAFVTSDRHPIDVFVGDGEVTLGSLATQVVEQAGLAVARRLGEPHVARHRLAEDLVAEEVRDLALHLVRDAEA